MPVSHYELGRMGTLTMQPEGPFVAGSSVTLTLDYTVGEVGIDDTGGIKISWQGSSDMGRAQFGDPAGPNYATVSTTGDAEMIAELNRANVRPWRNTIYVRCTKGYLRPGDRITVVLGDTAGGSPGLQLPTNRDNRFELRCFVDAFAIYEFIELDRAVGFELLAGAPVRWNALVPSVNRLGDPFRLAITAEDLWGNTTRLGQRFHLRSPMPIVNLPDGPGPDPDDETWVVEGLAARATGDLRIELLDATGSVAAVSNPMRVERAPALLAFWGDLHGQSGETAGSSTADDYFRFARDRAFVDIAGHSGNDFAITDAFWNHLNELTRRYNEPGRFVTLPGYEWSGNTAVGGDRNVYYAREGEPIHRSSRILAGGGDGANSDCLHVRDLFDTLSERDAILIAHVGGRFADLHEGHGDCETAVEVHSVWGTFEWILHDAFDLGHRVGVVCHSDDHEGRPGAARPGATIFLANGGLTCYRMPELTREALVEALRRRHHYGTTGVRIHLDVVGAFETPVRLLANGCASEVMDVMMGDIVEADDVPMQLDVDVVGHAPIERVTLFNGREPIEIVRPFAPADAGRRIRVMWEGAMARGRGRQASWTGGVHLEGNRFERADAVNFLHPERPLVVSGCGTEVRWDVVTAGQKIGVDLLLEDPHAGTLVIDTNRVRKRLEIGEIGAEDLVLPAGGVGLQMSVSRLPDSNPHHSMRFRRSVVGEKGRDNPIHARVTFEDGNQAWSSPIYLVPAAAGQG